MIDLDEVFERVDLAIPPVGSPDPDEKGVQANKILLNSLLKDLITRIFSAGTTGPRGYSNYELAQSIGFDGTLEEYLDSLKGKDGQIRYIGNGPPPDIIVGSRVGDNYLDRETGIIYELE